ncbi:MAG TPA: TrkA C-terminal domain-containing protein [Deltaproteobacteria bacterium]|nr:TrkA C-terminal domain-containing protein [Deltaproteobacteria bacterium]
MASVILLLVIIIASLVCVRAGATALELTGMEPEKARFQALSAFTNTGFTTFETEEITNISIRRKIVKVLIVFGHAGTVSVIATFATSLLQRNPLQTAVNIVIILVALYIIYRLAFWHNLTKRMKEAFRRWLIKRYDLRTPSLEQMLMVAENFGVIRLVIQEGSNLVARPLSELGLKGYKVQILSIDHHGDIIAIPQGQDILHTGDVVICYGDVKAAKELFSIS